MRLLLTRPPRLSTFGDGARALAFAGGHAVAVATPASIQTRRSRVRAGAGGGGRALVGAGGGRRPGRAPAGGQPWPWADLFLRQLTDPRDGRDVVGWRGAGAGAIVHDCSELGGAGPPGRLGLPCVTVGTMAAAPGLLERRARRPARVSLLPRRTSGRAEVRRYRREPTPAGDRCRLGAGLPADRPSSWSAGDGLHAVPGRLEAILAGLAEVEHARRRGAGDPTAAAPGRPRPGRGAHSHKGACGVPGDLLVTHAAANSVARRFPGVPMVLAPIVSDQLYNAPAPAAPGHRPVTGRGHGPPRRSPRVGDVLATPPTASGPARLRRAGSPAALGPAVRDVESLRGRG